MRKKKTKRSYKVIYALAAAVAFSMFLTWKGWLACMVMVFGILITLLLFAFKGEI